MIPDLPYTGSAFQFIEALAASFNFGTGAAVVWVMLLGSASVWAAALDWIDDQPVSTRDNPLVRVLMSACGYTERVAGLNNTGYLWCYYSPTKKRYSSGAATVVWSALVVFASVPVGLLLLVVYPLTLLLLLLVVLAFCERQRRRKRKSRQSEEAAQ